MSCWGVFLAVFLAFVGGPAAPSFAQEPQAAVTPSTEDGRMRALVERYLKAWMDKDIDALSRCWTDNSPDTGVLTEAVTRTRTKDFAFADLALTRVAAGPSEASARVTVIVSVTDRASHQVERTTWIKNFSFRRENTDWKISREAAAVSDLVGELRRRASTDERTALLDGEPALIGEALRRALEGQADSIIGRGQTREGLGLLDVAVDVARRSGSQSGEAAAVSNLALRNRLAGNTDVAIDAYRRALALYAAIPDVSKVAATEAGLAGVYYQSHDFAAATSHYQSALGAYRTIGDADSEASTWHSLGNVAYMEGDFVSALTHYAKSVEIQERLATAAPGERESALRKQAVASAYHALGMVQQEVGDYAAAEAAYQTSLSRSSISNDRPNMGKTHESLGGLYRLQRDYGASLREYLAALRLNEPEPGRQKDLAEDARLLTEIGEVYSAEQRFPPALDSLGKSLAIYEQLKSEQGAAAALSGIGAIHFAQGSWAAALDYDGRALERYERLGDRSSVALMHVRIGLVRAAQGQHAEALTEYQRGLTSVETSKDTRTMAAVFVLAAAEHATLGHLEDAMNFVSKAVPIAEAAEAFDVLSQARLVAGEVSRMRGDLATATREVVGAIAARERFRAMPAVGADDAFFPDAAPPYLAMVDLLVRQGKHAEAFDMAERVRIVRAQDRLGDGTLVTKGMTAEERANERQLRNQEQSLRRQVRLAGVQGRGDLNNERRIELDRRLADAIAARQRFAERLYASRPSLRQLRGLDEPATLASSMALLGSQTALLAYTVTESRTHLFVVTRRQTPPSSGTTRAPAPPPAVVPFVRVYSTDISPLELQRRVLSLRELIVKEAPVGAAARSLYDLLVKPADEQLAGAHRLLVVPDAALWALPLQALQARDDHFVIEDYAVAYGGSVSALLAANQVRKGSSPPSGRRIVAVGLDRVGPNVNQQFALVRPDLRFEPLQHAEAETRAVVAGLPPGQGVALTGADARQDRLAAEVRIAALLHLAVPGILNDSSPAHSMLGLPPVPDDAGRPMDTLDVMALEQNARTVVLSRLYGEPSQSDPGAGATLMAWAWWVAGAPTTIYTQWLVDAPATTTLMVGLRRALTTPRAAGALRPSEALRAATLELLRGPTTHPFYWAGFAVMGDAR
jgi:CHAT domain-containing protein/tetratricopeptide (TPR) repeat protein